MVDRAGDLAACRALLRGGSRTFYLAALALPPAVRRAAVALYAFCRVADDAVDQGQAPTQALAALHDRLERAYAGRPLPHPVDRAFAGVVADYGIPRALPLALLEGMAWDAQGRRYETLDELFDYAVRVAGAVGAMLAVVMGVRAPRVAARACELGVAMQLTNIARDVGEDARRGRLYLPAAWLRQAGIDPDAWLARPVASPALASVVARLLREADALYARAAAGIGALPWACRPAIHAAALLYAEIGRVVERRGADALWERAVVPAARKAALLARACAAALVSASRDPAATEPLPAAAFLANAVAHAPAGRGRTVTGLGARLVGVIELFERLERRDRAPAVARATPE